MSKKICLVAVDIRSSHNVGSILRTADGFSADVILVGITPRPKGDSTDTRLPHIIDKTNKEISKTALGAENNVNWKYFTDIDTAFGYLRTNGYEIIAIEQDKKSRDIKELKVVSPTALVLGPEVTGLSHQTLENCDKIFEIPMTGQKESFNVSVTAGIALYQALL